MTALSGSPNNSEHSAVTSDIQYLLVGNLQNRRIRMFVDALDRLGMRSPILVEHATLIRDPGLLDRYKNDRLVIRVDSSGEDEQVERLLLERGYDRARHDSASSICPQKLQDYQIGKGEILCPRQHHYGFEWYWNELRNAFSGMPNAVVMNDPESVLQLFDKRVLLPRYQQAGIPVAPFIETKPAEAHNEYSPDRLRADMLENHWNTVYVKLSCGSSASCLAVYSCRKDGSEKLITTVRAVRDRLFNSLKLQAMYDRRSIDRTLAYLLAEGCHIEKSIPKARLDGRYMDCRVLVVDAEPAFVVVRQNTHPITNLHLGGVRGNDSLLKSSMSDTAWQAAMNSCRQVWKQHNNYQVGVDLMFEPGFETHRILEANAFGDLLPNLYKDGLDVYAYQISRLAEINYKFDNER